MEQRMWMALPLALLTATLGGCIADLGAEEATGTATVCLVQDQEVTGVERLLVTFSRVELKEGGEDDGEDDGFMEDDDNDKDNASGSGQDDRVAGQPAGGDANRSNESDDDPFGENATANESDEDLLDEGAFEGGLAQVRCVRAEFDASLLDDDTTADNNTTTDGNVTGFGEDNESAGQVAPGGDPFNVSDDGFDDADDGFEDQDDERDARAGWVELDLGGAVTIDLLDLENATAAVVATDEVPEGTYSQIRLEVDEAKVVTADGRQQEVEVPGDAIIVMETFTVSEDEETEVLLDLQAELALRSTGNGTWMLRPLVQSSVRSGDAETSDFGGSGLGQGNESPDDLRTEESNEEAPSGQGSPAPRQGNNPPYP